MRVLSVAGWVLGIGMFFWPMSKASAQFSGTISTGLQTSSNIEGLDTSSPDKILIPALQLDYGFRPSPLTLIDISAGYAPNIYSLNSSLSYNELTLGLKGVFYLNHHEDIAKESAPELAESNSGQSVESSTQGGAAIPAPPAGVKTQKQDSKTNVRATIAEAESELESPSDTLTQLAVANLYALSGQMDSADVISKGIPKSLASQLSSLKDSISDALSTDADLLDSAGFDEESVSVMLSELQHLHGPLDRLRGHLPGSVQLSNFAATEGALKAALTAAAAASKEEMRSESDSAIPSGESASASTSQPATTSSTSQLSAAARTSRAKQQKADDEEDTPHAPSLISLNSTTRLRDFSSGDVSLLEDAADSDATTLSTFLTVPVAYNNHFGRTAANFQDSLLFGIGVGGVTGNPNDVHSFSLGAGLDAITSTAFAVRGSYDFNNSQYPFDSVYTNSENRFRLGTRVALSSAVIAFAEYSLGFRKYLQPLTGANGKSVASAFTKNTYGAGISIFPGDRWLIGALVSINRNPDLRGYVTTVGAKKRRLAVQVADDEFTYDLTRYAIFSTIRLPGDIDLGLDASQEHRQYGSVSKKGVRGIITVVSQGRTEDGTYPTIGLNKMWSFDNRFLGAFQSFSIQGLLAYTTVTSSDPNYSYDDTSVTITGSLGF